MRVLSRALTVYKGHVGAVLDVAWSPTGKEFATGSYDRTVRIFPAMGGTSREIYHTKRMQRVWTVKFSGDAKYILSGSDDTNIRLWKANASATLGRLLPAERDKMDYRNTLRKRFAHLPEIRKIETCVTGGGVGWGGLLQGAGTPSDTPTRPIRPCPPSPPPSPFAASATSPRPSRTPERRSTSTTRRSAASWPM
jgi:hypothetical protein